MNLDLCINAKKNQSDEQIRLQFAAQTHQRAIHHVEYDLSQFKENEFGAALVTPLTLLLNTSECYALNDLLNELSVKYPAERRKIEQAKYSIGLADPFPEVTLADGNCMCD